MPYDLDRLIHVLNRIEDERIQLSRKENGIKKEIIKHFCSVSVGDLIHVKKSGHRAHGEVIEIYFERNPSYEDNFQWGFRIKILPYVKDLSRPSKKKYYAETFKLSEVEIIEHRKFSEKIGA